MKMKRQSILVLTVIILNSTSTVSADMTQWLVDSGGNDNFYEIVFVADGIDWNEANLAASAVLHGRFIKAARSCCENPAIYRVIGRYSTNFSTN
jgi:hypothetical protein